MLNQLSIKIYADGANLQEMSQLCRSPWIKGFTTNPTLMRNAKVIDYVAFAHAAIALVGNSPISFEVFADTFDEIIEQALEIASWDTKVYVKVPVTNTLGESTCSALKFLAKNNVKLNVTAVFTPKQVEEIVNHLDDTPAIISIFAGRVADTGRDPKQTITQALEITKKFPNIEILWASCREIYNIIEADQVGCDIITVPNNFLKKLDLLGKDLTEFSLETVNMLTKDALAAGYNIPIKEVV